MNDDPSYTGYVTDTEFHDRYADYQDRYAENMRESDRVLLDLVKSEADRLGGAQSLLDIGCSTGNFLRHVAGALPNLKLTGGDMAADVVARCRAQPDLAGIEFEVMDMTAMTGSYGLIVANATSFFLDEDEHIRALASAAEVLEPGGAYLSFEWLHPFKQRLAIREISRAHPEGLTIHARPQDEVEARLREVGFAEVEFLPFEVPIDLERDATFSDNLSGFEDLNSHTVRTEDGGRMIFRGALYQPWCHMVARKA